MTSKSMFVLVDALSSQDKNKENSQTTLEAETSKASSKDLKMQVTVNKDINSIEKLTPNLSLARDQQIRRKT